MVIFINLDLLGVMYFWNITVSAVSFVCILMSTGLSVDYCVHIGHAFTHSDGETPNDRLVEAVKMLGKSVLQGGFTTFLGTIVLVFSSSDAFQTFFKMLFCTVLFGMAHGLVALPVFLATFYNLAGREAHYEHHAADDEPERTDKPGSRLAEGSRTKKDIEMGRHMSMAGVELRMKSPSVVKKEREQRELEEEMKKDDALMRQQSTFHGFKGGKKGGGGGRGRR